MSRFLTSTVTYTSVSFPVEDDSDIGSPGVDGPPIMPEDPYAYIMAAYQVPPSPDYIPLGKEPLPAAASPTADSPGYVPESDPEEEPEEDDEDPEEDPADYPADRDDDDDDDEDEDEDEEEEPPNPPPPFPPQPAHPPPPLAPPPGRALEEVERLLALTTPPPSPLTPLSSPLPQIPSSPLPIPSPPPNSPTHIEIPESCLPLWKRVRFASPTPSHEVGESFSDWAVYVRHGPAIAREYPYSVARGYLYGFIDMVDVAPNLPMSALIVIDTSALTGDTRVIKDLWASDNKGQSSLT
ncbi:hypothetical protein Tco_1124005 [Tanacetum coccineum]|uniref:Uncharacterized protein n=1 Tax=Tanacetum coccineum TaxID=301880 RepID=A0ABQ5J4Y3_9ASTR